MDKHEYQEYTEQLLQAAREGNYERAAMIADRLPWEKCRNADTLCKIAHIYERTDQYEKSQRMLFIAYNLDSTSKVIVYRLGLLAVKMGKYIEAENCYEEFVSLAPKDPNRYILKYRLLQARRAPIQERIAVLEAFKSAEYLEEWGYELALLYHEAGMDAECVEECDDLILWFSESEYAYKAMELKSQYKPLSDMQIERYSNKFGDTGSLMGTYSGDSAMAGFWEEEEPDSRETADAAPPEGEMDPAPEEGISSARQEGVADARSESRVLPQEPEFNEHLEAEEAELISVVEENRAEWKNVTGHAVAEQDIVLEESEVGISEDQKLADSLKIDEILNEWDQKQSVLDEPSEEEPEAVEESTLESELDSIISDEVKQLMAELEAGLDSAVISGAISLSEEEKKIEEERKIRERAAQEKPEPVPAAEEEPKEEIVEEFEEALEEDLEELGDFEGAGDFDAAGEFEAAGDFEEDGDFDADEGTREAGDFDADEGFREDGDFETDEDFEESLDLADAEDESSDDEDDIPRRRTGKVPKITTILDEPEEKPKKKKKPAPQEEPEKDIIEEPTIQIKKPVPQDTGFIIEARYDLDATCEIGTKVGLNEEQTKIFSYFVPVRGMSEQIVEVLNHDKYCRGRAGSSRTGNILIIGHKGSGKTVLAVDLIKAIQKQRQTKGGKVAIVNAASLNKKNISDIFLKLKRGALIIEQAGKLHPRTVEELNVEMEKQTEELLVVLEEEREPLKSLLRSNVRFAKKFTAKLEIPIFTNDELVTFAQTYAKENGYKMDDLAILALYSRIDAMQKESHSVSITEVKDVMDEAMNHSKKAMAKKFMKRLRGKSEDEEGRIILNEKDFV